MVRAKAKISYRDGEEEAGEVSEGNSYKADDSDEDVSDAEPAKKKHKKSSGSKKKVKKAKKAKKKSKYTDDSDEEEEAEDVEPNDDETAPATWRPGGPVVEAKKSEPKVATPKKQYIYKDASDQDFTDDGEIEDARDSDFDAKKESPKKTPAKKTPAKKGKKKTPAKKSPAAAKKKGKKAKVTNGTPRSSGRASTKIKYDDDEDEEDDEEEEEDDEDEDEEEVPLKKRKLAKQSKDKAAPAPKKLEIPTVADMVIQAIRGLRDNPRKGSSLAAIKGFMAEEWGLNIQDYAPKIKKFILRAVENEEVIQTKGKGASGRFTLQGMKARKRKTKTRTNPGKKFDVDTVEYEPVKSARDEAREQAEMEMVERRARLEEEAARKLAEKEMKPKKAAPVRKSEWVVSMVKGMKIVEEKTWYQVRWDGWPKPSWEPEENLHGCQELIDNFLFEEKTRLRMEEERRKREEEDGAYEVARILEVKFKKDGNREFLIRWKGHGASSDTWEPEEHLDCKALIEKFMEKHEKIVAVEEKELRIAPKKVQRLAYSAKQVSGRMRKTTSGRGFRATYEDMDGSDFE